MVELTARIATTGLVKQGASTVRLTREAIESLADQVNGERSLPFSVEHDPYCMPIGKINEAWVEPFEDEYAAMARIYVEDDLLRAIHKRSGTKLVSCLINPFTVDEKCGIIGLMKYLQPSFRYGKSSYARESCSNC